MFTIQQAYVCTRRFLAASALIALVSLTGCGGGSSPLSAAQTPDSKTTGVILGDNANRGIVVGTNSDRGVIVSNNSGRGIVVTGKQSAEPAAPTESGAKHEVTRGIMMSD